jgi:hypothetical protein
LLNNSVPHVFERREDADDVRRENADERREERREDADERREERTQPQGTSSPRDSLSQKTQPMWRSHQT